jgi:CHAD domain-containing protein
MAPVAHREIERKYEVPEGAEERIDWSGLQGYTVSAEPVEHRMEAVYYDTPDMALARRLVALRRRRGGADDGWHVKFHEPSGRRELQFPLLRTPERMPAAVRTLLAGLAGGERLRPVATLRTVRRVLMIGDPAGTEVAELAADVVEAVDERTGTVRSWSEWEVELVDGTVPEEQQEEIFSAVEEAVFAVGGRPSTSRAKIARALGAEDDDAVAAGPVPERAEVLAGSAPTGEQDERDAEGEPGPKGKKGKNPAVSGAELLRTVLAELAEQLVLWDFKVRLEVPDAVHQMRVTSRSLRSVLKAADPFLEGDVAEDLYVRLRELARTLSAARDAEVTAQLLPARVEELGGRVGPAPAAVLQHRAEAQAELAARSVRRSLASKEHLRLLADVREFAAAPPLTEQCAELSARKVASTMLRRALRKVVRVGEQGAAAEASGAGADAAQRLEHLHVVRKAVKRVRYVEAVLGGSGFRAGKSVRRAAADAREYQNALGRIMDAAVVEGWLARTAQALSGSGEDRYAVGLLHGAEVVHLHSGVAGGADVVGVLLAQLRKDLA